MKHVPEVGAVLRRRHLGVPFRRRLSLTLVYFFTVFHNRIVKQ